MSERTHHAAWTVANEHKRQPDQEESILEGQTGLWTLTPSLQAYLEVSTFDGRRYLSAVARMVSK